MDPVRAVQRLAAAHRIKFGAVAVLAGVAALKHARGLRGGRKKEDKSKKEYDPKKAGIKVLWLASGPYIPHSDPCVG